MPRRRRTAEIVTLLFQDATFTGTSSTDGAFTLTGGSLSANGGNLTSSLTEVVAGDTYTYAYNYVVPAAAGPAPPAAWLLCSGLLFLLGVAQTRRV